MTCTRSTRTAPPSIRRKASRSWKCQRRKRNTKTTTGLLNRYKHDAAVPMDLKKAKPLDGLLRDPPSNKLINRFFPAQAHTWRGSAARTAFTTAKAAGSPVGALFLPIRQHDHDGSEQRHVPGPGPPQRLPKQRLRGGRVARAERLRRLAPPRPTLRAKGKRKSHP